MKQIQETDVSDCKTYGLMLLQLMALLGVLGIVLAVAVRYFL